MFMQKYFIYPSQVNFHLFSFSISQNILLGLVRAGRARQRPRNLLLMHHLNFNLLTFTNRGVVFTVRQLLHTYII